MDMTVPAPVQAADRAQAALVVTPHPLTLQGQRVYRDTAGLLLPDETLAAFLARHEVLPGQQWVVTIGGVLVHEIHWPRVKPKHGHIIECRRVPERDVLRIAALVALSYFTFGAGGIGGGSFLGLTGTAGQLAAGVAYMAGSMVLNKLLTPKAGRLQDSAASPTYALNGGGRNQARPFAPMALVLGEPYAVPDLAAQPYSFFSGGEQHLWQMFHCGLNCADAQALRIGQTALDTYAGVTVLRNGFATGNSDFPALGTSVDSVAGGALAAPSGTGPWVLRTSSAGTVRLAVDLVASLFGVSRDGAYESRGLDVGIEYRAVGSGTWLPWAPAVAGVPAVTVERTDSAEGSSFTWIEVVTPAVPAVPAGVLRLSNASQKPLRLTFEREVPPGQYEVRLRKNTPDETSTTASNQVEWVSLKSYQQDTANYAGQSRLAVQIRASGQLNGTLDELNAALTAKPMPYWNGTAWTTATNRASGLCNPGAILLLLMRGIFAPGGRRLAGLGYADEQIDLPSLQAFMVHCAQGGYEFDLFLQEATTTEDLMNAVAYAGLGEITHVGGRLGVLFFRADDPVEAVINMANISARSFTVTYDTMVTADELEFQYFDRSRGNVWSSVRMVAPGVTTPRATARQQLVGVGSEAHAATLMRFAMAQNVYQRKTVSCEMDLEYMVYRRGQVVSLSHDLTAWGYGGRLQACELVGGTVRLTLDDTAPGAIPAGFSGRFIGLRLPGEQQMRVFPVRPFAGDGRVIELDAAWPGGVPLPGSSEDNPAHDTLWVYDFKATPGQLLRVVAIEPGQDGARMTLVPEVPEFWAMVTSGAYTAPANNSLLRPAPTVTGLRIVEELARQGNTFYTELSVVFETTGNFNRAEIWGAVGEGEASPPQRLLAGGTSQTLTWRGGLDERWHLELRVFGDTRQAEPFRLYYDVVGLREPPPAFDTFIVQAQPDGTRQYNFAYTTTVAPLDWAGAEIRYLPGTVASPVWDSMLPLQDDQTYYTASPVELNAPLEGAWTFACRSRDTTGNLSPALVRSITLSRRRSGSTFEEVPNDPTWPGVLSGFVRVGDVLEAASATTWATLPSTWDAWTQWAVSPPASASYTTPGLDLGTPVAGQVDATVVALGTVTVEFSSSADGTTWGAWQPAANVFTARWVRLRVTVAATGSAPLATLQRLDWRVSAEIQREYLNDVVISGLTGLYRIGVGDVRAPIARTYLVIRNAVATVQDNRTGSWTVTRVDKNTTTGPRFQFYLNGTLTDPQFVDFDIEGI
jgi:hypothetical protein